VLVLLQKRTVDLRPILAPTIIVVLILFVGGFFVYKCQISTVIAQMRVIKEKRSPPKAEQEITLVLTDVQVGSDAPDSWKCIACIQVPRVLQRVCTTALSRGLLSAWRLCICGLDIMCS
jgi:hypothetical protein